MSSAVKKFNQKQNILVLLTVFLLLLAIFHSIYTDGLGIAIIIMFPYSFFILIITIIAFISGFKSRKELKLWFVRSLIILFLGLITLWTPILKHSRAFVERQWRWSSREQVVADVKSGILLPCREIENDYSNEYEKYYVKVPFEKYGRISFMKMCGESNEIEVVKTRETSYVITFTTDGGFFGPKDQLIYTEIGSGIGFDHERSVKEHWYTNTENFNLFGGIRFRR